MTRTHLRILFLSSFLLSLFYNAAQACIPYRPNTLSADYSARELTIGPVKKNTTPKLAPLEHFLDIRHQASLVNINLDGDTECLLDYPDTEPKFIIGKLKFGMKIRFAQDNPEFGHKETGIHSGWVGGNVGAFQFGTEGDSHILQGEITFPGAFFGKNNDLLTGNQVDLQYAGIRGSALLRTKLSDSALGTLRIGGGVSGGRIFALDNQDIDAVNYFKGNVNVQLAARVDNLMFLLKGFFEGEVRWDVLKEKAKAQGADIIGHRILAGGEVGVAFVTGIGAQVTLRVAYEQFKLANSSKLYHGWVAGAGLKIFFDENDFLQHQ